MDLSLSTRFAPRTMDEVPWSPEDKRRFRDVVRVVASTASQDTVLLVGANGSGKSTLLHYMIVQEYIHAMHQVHAAARHPGATIPSNFRERCVMTFYTQKMELYKLRSALASFPFLQIAKPWHRLLLLDDIDLFQDNEKHVVLDMVRAAPPRLRMFFTCTAVENVPGAILRRAVVFRLPPPALNLHLTEYLHAKLHMSPNDVARAWRKAAGEDAAMNVNLFDLWNAIDVQHMVGDGDDDDDDDCPWPWSDERLDTWLLDNDGAAATATPCAKRISDHGIGVNDFLMLCWRRVRARFPAVMPERATRIVLFIAEEIAYVTESQSSTATLQDTIRRMEDIIRGTVV